MKSSPTSTVLVTFFSSAMAFTPASQKTVATTNMPSEATASPAIDLGDKGIYDPLGLYPKDAPERMAGLIQPLESSAASSDRAVFDPLGLYRGQSQDQVVDQVEASASLPFLPRPEHLDGSLAGDRGFDPFNFASSPEALLKYRNSELKHARLAMLATVGWPIAELFHKDIAAAWNMPSALNLHDRVPSVLNGGLGNVSPVFWVAALAAAASIEALSGAVGEIQSADLGFDPLGFLSKEPSKRNAFLAESEIFNGRLAMLAITGFAIQEWFTGNSVVDAIPIFFKPLNVVMEQLLNSGLANSV